MSEEDKVRLNYDRERDDADRESRERIENRRIDMHREVGLAQVEAIIEAARLAAGGDARE